MRVFKFGGASVRDAKGIINLYNIVSKESDKLVIVVSAFGKTTNALESLHLAWRNGDRALDLVMREIVDGHLLITEELFGKESPVYKRMNDIFSLFHDFLNGKSKGEFDHDYDMIVSNGEVWSTIIVEAYLRSRGLRSHWKDIRKLFTTDKRHREAGILWEISREKAGKAFTFTDADIYVTQGFIGATEEGEAVTLGREGSDYTAAVIASMLDAVDVVVWKDVPGIMNADPDWMPSAVTLPHISYLEAVEMTYSGAKIIHPKTIKPLHNKKIPMLVKPFADPDAPGTIISEDAPHGDMSPVYVRKQEQILISLMPKDLSFVMGDNLAGLFHVMALHGVRVNLVQTGAVSINICADHEEPKISDVIEELKNDYSILYNDGAEMLTVRHSAPDAALTVVGTKEVLLSQKTRNTVRLVVRER
jgi:aspartate kinase